MFRSLLSLLFLFFHLSSFSQKTWKLEDCLNHARQNNITVKREENMARLNRQNSQQTRISRLPSINASGSHSYNYGRNIDPYTNQFTNETIRYNDFGASGSVVLFNGFALTHAIKQSEFVYKASTYNVETISNEISLNITTLYLQILFSEELLRAAESQLEISSQQYKRTQRLVEEGVLPKENLFEIGGQMATEETQVIDARNQLQLASINLKQLLNLNATEQMQIVPVSVNLPDTSTLPEVQNIYISSVKVMPQVKSAEYTLLGNKSAYKAAKARQSPVLTLEGSLNSLFSSSSKHLVGTFYQEVGITQNSMDPVFSPAGIYEKTDFRTQIRNNYNKSFGVRLSIPILNGFQRRFDINRNRIITENSEYNLELIKLDLQNDIQKAYAEVILGWAKYTAALKSVEVLTSGFNNNQRKSELGTINMFEYNQSKTRLVIQQSGMLQAKYDYIIKRKFLDYYQGIPITLNY